MKKIFILILTFAAVFTNAKADGTKEVLTDSDLSTIKSLDDEKLSKQTQDPKLHLRFDTRFDGLYEAYGESLAYPDLEDGAGFIGRYFNLCLDGAISKKFSYAVRYRLYTNTSGPTEFFSTVDWANITYNINDRFFLNAGKQVNLVGGFEYDLAPIDGHFWSYFWNHTNAYQIGVLGGYKTKNKKHTIQFQIVNSVFSKDALESTFGYNLIWYGNMDWFKTIYSVNFAEIRSGEYINYIALGNRFEFGNFKLDIDYMNRAALGGKFFGDYSVIGNVQYKINEKFNVFAKGGYDQNDTQVVGLEPIDIMDSFVPPGTAYSYYGAGIEYYPIITKRHNVRLHAFWYNDLLNNMPSKNSFNIGIKWEMNILTR